MENKVTYNWLAVTIGAVQLTIIIYAVISKLM